MCMPLFRRSPLACPSACRLEAGGDMLTQCMLATPTKEQPSLIHLSWYTTHTNPKAACCQRISGLQLGGTTRAQCAEAQLQDAGRLCSLERTASHARSERGLCWPTLLLHKRSAREGGLREDTLSKPHVVAHERLTPNLPPQSSHRRNSVGPPDGHRALGLTTSPCARFLLMTEVVPSIRRSRNACRSRL
jgi:hypothetical protein